MARLRRPLIAGLFLVAILLVLWSFVGRINRLTATSDTHGTELLRKAAAFIQAQKTFSVVVEVEVGLESQRFGKSENTTSCSLSVGRPDRLAMREQSGPNGLFLVADGIQFSRGIRRLKEYFVSEDPSSLDEVFYDPVAYVMCKAIGIPFFRSFLHDHVYEELMYDVIESHDLGVEEIDGHAYGHLRLEQNESVWDLWVDTGTTPLIKKVSIQPKESSNPSGQDETQLKMSVVYQFRDWNLKPQFPESEFVFNPPAGWKIDNLSGHPGRDFANRPGTLTSLGEQAPDITITTLEGTASRLADLRGHVTLVNFFATWCGPCKLEMPDLQKIWNEFRDHDEFRMFVIGREESTETVRAFKDAHGFTFPMASDLDRSAFGRFATETIPRTYLIDRDGKIVYQYTGYDIEKKERRKLRALLKKELGKRE